MKSYFVFGSNESGIHGAGAARHALTHGAKYGVGFGPIGNSWAIPTKDWAINKLPFKSVKFYVERFIAYTESHEDDIFHLTKIGCGLAGFTETEISVLFVDAPDNVLLIDDDGKVVCPASQWYDAVRMGYRT